MRTLSLPSFAELRALDPERAHQPGGVAAAARARLGYEGQPREAGRFAEGKEAKPDTPATRAQEQATMRDVPFALGAGQDAAVAAWRAEHPDTAAEYEAAVNAWSNQENGIIQTEIAHGNLTDPDAQAIAHYLDLANPTTAPMYRGCSALATMKDGYEFNLPPSSFTDDKTEGVNYAFNGDRAHPAVLEVQAGARGMPVGALSTYPEERETIGAGRYQVQSTTMETFNYYGKDVSYPHIVVKQVK